MSDLELVSTEVCWLIFDAYSERHSRLKKRGSFPVRFQL